MAEQIPLYMADSGKFQKMLPTDTLPASMVTWSNPSIGVFADTAPTIVDNGNGTVTVGATVVALATATTVGATIAKFTVAGATFSIPADSQTYYICAKYSANTASYYLEVLEGNINARTITPVYACWNILGVISSQYFGTNGDILANKIDYAQIDTVPYRRSIAGGLIISEASLVWSTTAATIYAGTTPIALSAMTASTSNLVQAYHVAGVWTYSVGTATYDNVHYDNGTALVAMGTNKYAVRWIFRSVSNPAQLIYVCGTAYYSAYDAAAAELMRTDLPEVITKHCILVGKAIVQSGATAGVTISTFDVSFAGGAISSDHNSLGGIYGDSPFYHLSLGAYTQTNNILALTGTGLLKLTAGTPSIDSTSYWSSANHPTVLYNYGITSSDATLDGRYLQLIGGILTGSLFGVNSYLNANENTHDTAPVLTLTNSIYTLGTTLLLAAGTGSTSEIGFSNIGKPAGNQRWNIGVSNDIFYIGGNPTNSTGNLNPYTFSRSGNLGVYGSVTAASFIGPLSGNASSASKIGTARSIALTGDGSWSVSFDGSANATGKLTLATLLTAGSAGSATTVPTLTWDAKGRLTAVGSAAISIPHTQINDWSTATSSFLTANQAITLSGAISGSGTTSIATSFANTHLAGINQDLTTASSPTFAAIVASNSYYGVFGTLSSDAQKWYLVATVDLSAQYDSASAVIRFNSAGGNVASGLGWQWAGSCFIRAKQQSSMSSGLDSFTIGWNYCHGFNPGTAVIGVKTTDNASHKTVNIYLLCPASYDGMSWQIDNLAGSITASRVGTNYVTTLPTGLATYTGASAIWSDWTNIAVPGASTFTGLITANGGISGNLTGHASLDIPLAGSSAITGSLIPLNTSSIWLGGPSKTWAYGFIDNLTVSTITAGSGSSGNCSISLGGTGQYGMYLGSLALHIASAGNIITDNALLCSGAFRSKYQEKSADYTVTDSDCGTIIAMTTTGVTMTIQAGSNYTAGFSVDIAGPGGGTISSNIHFTDSWCLNGTRHAANTNLGLQDETASIRYVTGVWYVSLP